MTFEFPEKLTYTPVDEIPAIVSELTSTFRSKKTLPVAFRVDQLRKLTYLLKDHQDDLAAALEADLGKRRLEAYLTELIITLNDAIDAAQSVGKWVKPEKPWAAIPWSLMSPEVRREPKGISLIVSPFNYPVNLTFGPLIGALAAGCTVVIKPSEHTVAFSSLIADLIPRYLDSSVVRVVNGAVPETTALLKQKWAHIFYTGNSAVGRIVARAAAENLTPVTLELGGKSPAVVADDADLKTTASHLLWGKTTNVGQTCIAPDYVLCSPKMQDKLVYELTNAYNRFFPDGPAASDSLGRIIHDRAFVRLTGLIADTKGEVVLGGDSDRQKRFIAPTVVKNVSKDDALMKEELFGPILPIVTVPSIDHAIKHINSGEHPLALYVFTQNKRIRDHVFDNTLSGSATANDVLIQNAIPELPFGGVGESGYGAYHGKRSFDVFTYERPRLTSPLWLEVLLGARYPPYTEKNLRMLTAANARRIPFPRPGQPRSLLSRILPSGVTVRWALVLALLGWVGKQKFAPA